MPEEEKFKPLKATDLNILFNRYMATTGMDRRLKIFDLRMYKELSRFQYMRRHCPGLLDFSQKGILAVSRDNVVEVRLHLYQLIICNVERNLCSLTVCTALK